MTVTEPIPAGGQWGAANWSDYISNWRDADAEWLQSRSILRYADTASITALPAPQVGQIVFNNALDHLMMRSKTNAWFTYRPLPQFLAQSQDDATGVALSHSTSGNKGITFTPTQVLLPHTTNIANGVLTVDGTGLLIKTGTKTVKATTDTAGLVLDSPITLPSLNLTGTGTVIDATGKAIVVGTLTADAATVNTTFTVAVGATATIAGVESKGSKVTAVNGFISDRGLFIGNASGGQLRYRDPSTGTQGTGYVEARQADVNIFGTTVTLSGTDTTLSATNTTLGGQAWVNGGRGVAWRRADGVHVAWLSPSIVSATDPVAANFPDGTIWCQP